MPSAGTVFLEVRPLTDSFGTDLKKQVEPAMARVGQSMQRTGKALTKAVTLPIAAGFAFAIKEANEAQKVMGQTQAVLKSTGGAANVSAKQITAMATSLMKKTAIDDEAIQSGQNLLLTFTNIRNEAGVGNDIFSQATEVMLDMSVALGQDMKSSAIQLGKALQDPIKGVTALRRVGVNFTEAQTEMIRGMVENNNLLGAQQFILKELRTEFEGSAAAQATALDHVKVSFGELAESVGEILLPVVSSVASSLGGIATAFTNLDPGIKTLIVGFLGLAAVLGPLLWIGGKLVSSWSAMSVKFKAVGGAAGVATKALQTLRAVATSAWTGIAVLAAAAISEWQAHSEAIGSLEDAFASARDSFVSGSSEMVTSAAELGEVVRQNADLKWEGLEPIRELLPFMDSAAEKAAKIKDEFRALIDEQTHSLPQATREIIFAQVEMGRFGDAVTTVREAWNVFIHDAKAGQAVFGGIDTEVDRLLVASERAGFGIEETGRKIKAFGDLTKEEFGEFIASTTEGFDQLGGALSEFRGQTRLTSAQLVEFFHKNMHSAEQWNADLRSIIRSGAPQELIQYLIEQGPEALHAYATANKNQQRTIRGDWRDTRREANEYDDLLRGLPDNVKTRIDLEIDPEVYKFWDIIRDNPELLKVSGGAVATTKHSGGMVGGPGSQEVLVKALSDEYIVRPEAVKSWGVGFLDAVNKGDPHALRMGDFHTGGFLGAEFHQTAHAIKGYDAALRSLNFTLRLALDTLGVVTGGPAVAGATPAISAIYNATMAAFPGQINSYGIKNIRGINFGNPSVVGWSQHAYGNAWDWMAKSGMAGTDRIVDWQRSAGLPITQILWRVANHFDHAHTEGAPRYGGNPYTGGYPIMHRGGVTVGDVTASLRQREAVVPLDTPHGRRELAGAVRSALHGARLRVDLERGEGFIESNLYNALRRAT